MTKYLVLRHHHPNPDHWQPCGEVEAASAGAAIRSLISGDDMIKMDGGGEFVAVPARSWRPVNVAVEQALKFS